jgi:hypothetical protein
MQQALDTLLNVWFKAAGSVEEAIEVMMPMCRTGKRYFANYSNLLVGPETGLDDKKALDYLAQE